MKIYAEAVPGIPIFEPEQVPLPGEVVVGYKIIEVKDNLFVRPRPSKMNMTGWISVVVCAICFWPVSCIPCCLSCSYSRYQVPVYGDGSPFSRVTLPSELMQAKLDVSEPKVMVQKSAEETAKTDEVKEDKEVEPVEVKEVEPTQIQEVEHKEK